MRWSPLRCQNCGHRWEHADGSRWARVVDGFLTAVFRVRETAMVAPEVYASWHDGLCACTNAAWFNAATEGKGSVTVATPRVSVCGPRAPFALDSSSASCSGEPPSPERRAIAKASPDVHQLPLAAGVFNVAEIDLRT